MTVETQEPVDIFSMSSEDFAKYSASAEASTTSTEESTDVDSSTDEVVEPIQEQEDIEQDVQEEDLSTEGEDEYIDVEGADDEIDLDSDADTGELDSDSSEDNELEQTTDLSDEVDSDGLFNKLFAEPIKANGKEYKVESKDDAIKLMQMGMGFYKNMEALKPKRALIAMLEQNNIDEEKLNYAIDLLNKNPQAINKLIADQDLSEIVDDSNADYTPNNYRVDERQLNVKEALAEIENTPTYSRTVNVLGKEWDETSRSIVQDQPHLIATINSHMINGMFDNIIAEVDKRMMLGSIPMGTPMLHAYKMVGDEMYANAGQQTAPMGQQVVTPQANAKPPIRKPSEQVRQNKLAASKPRQTPAPRQTPKFEDVFTMSDEEFNKKYGFN